MKDWDQYHIADILLNDPSKAYDSLDPFPFFLPVAIIMTTASSTKETLAAER